MCARKKEVYKCRNQNEARIKLFDLVYKKYGYWAIIDDNGEYTISNYTSKKNKVLMDVWI